VRFTVRPNFALADWLRLGCRQSPKTGGTWGRSERPQITVVNHVANTPDGCWPEVYKGACTEDVVRKRVSADQIE
jgi:hypothetical protein